MAAEKSQPKAPFKTPKMVVAPLHTSGSTKPRRGRPAGTKDNKPRKKRADAGKTRGKYKR